MSTSDKENYLQEILSKVQQGNGVLFLGAGASHIAGGPTGKKLTEMIKENFPKVNQSIDNFIEVCQDVVDTPPYDRNELEEFIRGKLATLQPTLIHKMMTKIDWSAIFTTNFDDIVEVAYRTTPDRLKPLRIVFSDRPQVNPADKNKLYLFKIMGSIAAMEEESDYMVLTRADYHRALQRRTRYFDLLYDFIKTGTIIFIGYSFGDRVVLDIMDELIIKYGKDRLPWSYALFDQIKLDDKTAYMFSSRKIIPIECDFDNFIKYVGANYTIPLKVSKNVQFKLRGQTLEISEHEARHLAEYFEILDEDKVNQPPGEKDKFFMGTNKSWGVFKEKWDFKRDFYISPDFKQSFGGEVLKGCIKDRVFSELKKHDVNDNKVLLFIGMPGVGKTMILNRLAYDIYTSGEAPAIIISSKRISFDYKLIAAFIENLNHQLNQKIPQGAHAPPIKPVIIFDDAASLIRHVNRLKDYLTSRGRPALIIAAERAGEWKLMWEKFPFVLSEKNIYELNEQLTENEKTGIIEHFYSLGYISTKGIYWDDIIDRTFESSFFATIYTLVHPSKKPLNEIIKDQYKNLSELSQKAFQYICCYYQYDLPINLELLVRSLKCSYDYFYSDIVGKEAIKVVFEEQDEIGNILYRAHHRIIARKTIESFFGDPEMQKNIFLDIFKNAVLSNLKERELCEKLLVEHIGPNAKPRFFTSDQQRQIFRTICERNQIRTLIHHWGILEADDDEFLEAERLLKWALDIPRDDMEAYRGESDQNILTSLGSLYSRMAIDFLRKEKINDAEEYFKNAELAFQDAKHGEFPNAYAYHSHAYMWYLRGNREQDDPEKINYYAKALEIISVSKDNLNNDELQALYELESMIWSQIGDETRIAESLEILRDKFGSARGYYLNAELLWKTAREQEGEKRKKNLTLALRKLEKGLKFFPHDEHCLRLQSRLIKELEPNHIDKYYISLQKWKAAATAPNARLLYELGRTSFILDYYDSSKEFFKELEMGVGLGHRLRTRPRNPILDEKGNKKEFEGTIINILSLYEGIIRCETLRNLKYPIAFRPIACKFTPSIGDSIKFNIEFSYRGARAENVRKM